MLSRTLFSMLEMEPNPLGDFIKSTAQSRERDNDFSPVFIFTYGRVYRAKQLVQISHLPRLARPS